MRYAESLHEPRTADVTFGPLPDNDNNRGLYIGLTRLHVEVANDNTLKRDGGVPAGLYSIENDRIGDFMQTWSGRKVWPLDPRADEIFLEDIAHALSMQCRYAGHSKRFYSVAEHSVLMARWLYSRGWNHETMLWALLHDSSEAYLVDVPRPLKRFLPGYKEAETAMMNAVCDRFGMHHEMPLEVHEADERIIGDELVNMAPMDWHAKHNNPLGVRLRYWAPDIAEAEFLTLFHEIGMLQRRAG